MSFLTRLGLLHAPSEVMASDACVKKAEVSKWDLGAVVFCSEDVKTFQTVYFLPFNSLDMRLVQCAVKRLYFQGVGQLHHKEFQCNF